jgi:hypothetical protein
VQIELSGTEQDMLTKSIASVQTLVEACKTIAPDLGK